MRLVQSLSNPPTTPGFAALGYADLPDHRLRGRILRRALRLTGQVIYTRPQGFADLTVRQCSDRETALLNAAVLLLRLQDLPRPWYVSRRTHNARQLRARFDFRCIARLLGHSEQRLRERCRTIRPARTPVD